MTIKIPEETAVYSAVVISNEYEPDIGKIYHYDFKLSFFDDSHFIIGINKVKLNTDIPRAKIVEKQVKALTKEIADRQVEINNFKI